MPSDALRHPYPVGGQFPRGIHYGLAAVAATVAVAYGSLVPFEFRPIAFSDAMDRFFRGGFWQFGLAWREDLAVNILLFVPIGYLALGAIDVDRRSRFAAVVATPVLVLLLACASTAIEFLQMWFPRRSPSLGDVLSQAVGACVGIAAWWAVGRGATAWLRAFFSRSGPAVDWRVRLLQFYLAGFIAYQLLPLDLVVSPEEIRWKIEMGRVLLVPFTNEFRNVFEMLWQWVMDVILFIPVGMLMRVGWVPKGYLRPVSVAAGMIFGLAIGIEAAQLFIFSRFVDATDVITSGMGGLIGAAVVEPLWRGFDQADGVSGARMAPEKRVKAALLICGVYAVPVIASYWYPFDWVLDGGHLRAQLRGFLSVPFIHFYWGSEYVAATNMIRSLMLFVPIGAVLRWGLVGQGGDPGVGPGEGSPRAWVWCLVIATSMGLVIELGQAMTVSGTADITDLVLYVIGSLLGWKLAGRWLGDRSG